MLKDRDLFELEGKTYLNFAPPHRQARYDNRTGQYDYSQQEWQLYALEDNAKTFNPKYIRIESLDKVKELGPASPKEIVARFQHIGLELLLKQRSMTSGCDPEIFVVDSKGAVIPAFAFLSAQNAGRGFYYDGFQAEISPPHGHCLDGLKGNVWALLKSVKDAARAHDPKARLTLENVIKIPTATMKAASDKQVELGCAPSLNAYEKTGLVVAEPRLLNIRFAGGHMHFGGFSPTVFKKEHAAIVKVMDAISGVAGVSLAATIDNPLRRRYYGLAGEYRAPSHGGLEYRVLSNYWLCAIPIYYLTFDLARQALRLGASADVLDVYMPSYDEDEVQEIINNCDVSAARKYITKNKVVYMALLSGCYSNAKIHEHAYKTILNGVESTITDPWNVEANWHLNNEQQPNGRWVDHAAHA